ncbi:MAG: hypothetical protein IJ292_00050, partial [Clostridia bacterium]|nr:hypothetical protein [Clostridia bacterium]
MKRSLIFVICTIFLIMSAMVLFALDAQNVELTTGKDAKSQAILDSFSEYIEQNSTVTEYSDGTKVVELSPLASSITLGEILDEQNVVTVNRQPQYSTKLPDYSYTTNQQHTPVAIEQNYLYSLYNDEYKAFYRSFAQTLDNLGERTETFSFADGTEASTFYFGYLFDNPQYFYAASTCAIYTEGTNKYSISITYSIGNNDGDSSGYGRGELTEELKSRILDKKATFDQTVDTFISTIPSNAPDVVKERLVYAKILRNSYYNLDAVNNKLWDGLANDNWTAYGILVNGYGVCESYAEAFQTLCKAVGIPCTGVIGTAGGGHKWNAVKIGGEWYQCDITFDDPIGGEEGAAYSQYFNLTDTQMTELHHDWSNCDFSVPVCTATEYGRDNFFNIFEEDSEGTLHFFLNKCDSTCENCSFTRYVGDHEYADDQSEVCIHCGHNRPNGWIFENNNWYYYEDNMLVRDAWRMAEHGERYLGYNGVLVTNDWVYKDTGNFPVFVGEDGYRVRNSWVTCFGERFYCDENGYKVYFSFIKDGDRWAYVNESGIFTDVTGWLNYENDRYYIENGYRLENAWATDFGGRRYLDENGKYVKDTFVRDNIGLAYIEDDGYFKGRNNWLYHNDTWYFLENGYAVINTWRLDSIGWCYLGEDGAMLTNVWLKDSVGWCWLDDSGYWDGVYHNSNSFEKNGWQQEGGIWYYYENDEKVVNAWREDSTGWCFLDEEGKWVIDAFVRDSVGWAYITKNGYFYYDTNGWVDYYGTWYYVENGYAVTNAWRADSVGWCYLSETGAMVTNGFVEDSVGLAYITGDGYFYYTENGWRLVDGQWYFVENGYAVT